MAIGQNIVSTNPQTKLVVLEEFGGMYCVYCPEGHQVLHELSSALGENLVKLNYHEGYYAIPLEDDLDLRSDFGEEIMYQTELSGFPAATVNRMNFPGYEQSIPGSTALGRAEWSAAIGEMLQEPSPVNIAAEATLNIATRELEVYIEYYYTADAPGDDNRLNVAILQNNVLAPQHGGSMGNYYVHQYLVRDFLTGQWGHVINNNHSTSFGSLTYNFTLPLDYREVEVDPFNIELAIFIGEDRQNIFTGIQVTPELVSTFSSDANLRAIYASDDICETEINANLLIRNDGNEVLESMDIVYQIEGYPEFYFAWEGSLSPLEEAIVYLPAIEVPVSSGHYNFIAHLEEPNAQADPTVFNNNMVHSFCVAPRVAMHDLELAIRTDEFGYELYWEILDDSDVVHASGGNLLVSETTGGYQIASPSDPGAYPSNSFFIEDIYLPVDGCYRLRVLDDYGDGLCCEYGTGFFKLREIGQPPFIEGGLFSAIDEYAFVVNQYTTAATIEQAEKNIEVFPNPVKAGQVLSISSAEMLDYQWQLFGLSGQLVSRGDQTLSPETSGLASGYYLLSIQTEETQQSFPVIIQ